MIRGETHVLPLAHGIGTVQDLPVPLWLFFYGGAIALAASFVALGALWRRPRLEGNRSGRPLPALASRLLLSRGVRVVLGALSFGLLVLVLATALFGEPSPSRNLAPTFVYVVFWLGLVPAVVLLGNVWPTINPWKAAADAVAWLGERIGGPSEPLVPYPERLGRWPAAFLLLAFATLELAYSDPADPRALAIAIVLYSGATWLGSAVFGRDAWFRHGDAFTVYFGLLARIAPVGVRRREGRPDEREIVLRPPLVGLAGGGAPAGTLAFVAVMLGSVAFDSISQTVWWQNRRLSLAEAAPGLFELTGFALNLAGLVLVVLAVALAYLGAVRAARAVAGSRLDLADAFVGSLVPIALVYAVAHYFSLLIVQGQFAIPLASDPFGFGWNLFGSADYRPNLAPVSPNGIWYVQVGALVIGHVLGLVLAHDRAIALFRTAGAALRTQYAMLALMVLYTVGGLWLLSEG